MTKWGVFCLVLLGLAACENNDTGPVYPVQDALYEWVFSPDAQDPKSQRAPDISDPVLTFQLNAGQRRSSMRFPGNFNLGQAKMVGFDIRVGRTRLPRRPITISRVRRVGPDGTEILSVQLDAKRGVTLFGRTCVPAKDLQDWHRVEMRMRFSNQDTGFLEVFCDRKPFWGQRAVRTTQPPTCKLSDGCTTPVERPIRFEWEFGLMADRAVPRRTDIQMQRLHERRLFVIPNRIRPDDL